MGSAKGIKQNLYNFFQNASCWYTKKAPAGSRRANKKQVFEKHKQGAHEKGLRQTVKKIVMDGLSPQALARSYRARTRGREWE